MALPSLTTVQVDFSAGQITEKAARRDDIKLQRMGLKQSVNTRAIASGALQQRMGRSAYNLDTGRTETVRFSDLLKYGFLFGAGALRIRDIDDVLLNEFSAQPWTLDTIADIGIAVAERDVILTYPNTRPKHLRLGSSADIDPSSATAFADMLDALTYPVVEGTATSRQNTEVSSHAVRLPSGIQAGELLLIFLRTGGAGTAPTTPTGWTLLATRTSNGTTSIFYRVATGSEGSSVEVATPHDARRSVAISYRISGFSGAPEGLFTGSNTTNPPLLTPSWGSVKALWLAVASMRRSDQTVTAAPTSYSDLIDIANTSNSSANYAHIASAWRQVTGSSENPGDFTIVGSADQPHSATIAVDSITDAGEAGKAFDGVTNKAAADCLTKSAATSALVGLDLTASPTKIAGARVYGSNNQGYVNGLTPTVTLTLYGKNGSIPTIASPGSSLGTASGFTDTGNESTAREITSSDTTTEFDYVAIVISHDGVAAAIYVAQVVFEMVGAVADNNNWQIGPYLFDETPDGAKRQPYYRYAAKGIEMLCSARSGNNIDVTFSAAVLDAAHVGVSFRFHEREVVITSVTSATAGKANVIEKLPPARRVAFAAANARDSFKLGQVAIGETSGAEGYVVASASSTLHTATITVTIAYPAVVSWATHGLQAGDPFVPTTTGALPTGIVAGETYYVSATSLTAGTFQLSAVPSGPSINTSGSQSGTHTGTNYRDSLDLIVYKGDNFAAGERITSSTGQGLVIGVPPEITLPASVVWDEALMSDYRGWPNSVSYDRSRLIFCDFPQLPRAIAESAIGSPNDFLIGAEADDAFLEFAPGSGRVLHVIGGNDQFVLTDLGCLYIPISEANPLRPGSVSFRPIAAVGAGTVTPAVMHEGIVYATANRLSLIAIVPTGQTSFPYRTAAISEFHADQFTGVRALAAMAGGGSQAEQYLWAAQDDGTGIVGKFDSSNEWAGFVPVTGEGLIRWVSSLGGAVLFNVEYDTAFDWTMERLDEEQFVDCGVPLNQDLPSLRPTPEDETLGRLWFLAGLSVDLMNGETYLATRLVDEDGFVVEEDDDDFSGGDVVAGFAFTVTVEPFLPNIPEGDEKGQRVRRRRAKRSAVHVQDSTQFVFQGRVFGGEAAVSGTFRAPGEGRTFEPSVLLTKTMPGPLRITEIDVEVTV